VVEKDGQPGGAPPVFGEVHVGAYDRKVCGEQEREASSADGTGGQGKDGQGGFEQKSYQVPLSFDVVRIPVE
jgi:hypothetical protein